MSEHEHYLERELSAHEWAIWQLALDRDIPEREILDLLEQGRRDTETARKARNERQREEFVKKLGY